MLTLLVNDLKKEEVLFLIIGQISEMPEDACINESARDL